MNPSTTLPTQPKNSFLTALLSLVVPGAGQIYLNQYTRGAIIFVMTVVLGYVIKWAAEGSSKVGEMELGERDDDLGLDSVGGVLGVECL